MVNTQEKQINITLELPKKLERCLIYLENISKKDKSFIIKEALIQYIEDMEDIQKYSLLEILEKGQKQKTYTSEEIEKELGI